MVQLVLVLVMVLVLVLVRVLVLVLLQLLQLLQLLLEACLASLPAAAPSGGCGCGCTRGLAWTCLGADVDHRGAPVGARGRDAAGALALGAALDALGRAYSVHGHSRPWPVVHGQFTLLWTVHCGWRGVGRVHVHVALTSELFQEKTLSP